ncbi:Unknown protein, partial [Striga hermonthica]
HVVPSGTPAHASDHARAPSHAQQGWQIHAAPSPCNARARSLSRPVGRASSRPPGHSRPAVRPDRKPTGSDWFKSREGCTWDRFKELIREKYYPAYYRAEMERQFLSLQQGTRTLDKYEHEFTRLGAFVPDLVSTEAKRSRHFTDGLLPAVRHNIVGHGTQTYARTVTIARKSTPASGGKPTRDNKKRKGKGFQNDRKNPPRQVGAARPQQIPPCATCGRPHRGECHFGQDICYYCHQPDHFVNNCPERPQPRQQPPQQRQQQQSRQQAPRPSQQQQQRGRHQARVYVVDQVEAEQHLGTMSGMIMLNDVPVFALFDTGATHSFISRQCLDAIGVHSITTIDPLEVSLASGRKIVTDAKSTDLILSIDGRILSTDAYALEMRDFDLILGMDWLTYFHVGIRCHDREITLCLPRDEHITFYGTKTCSLPHVFPWRKPRKCYDEVT